MTLGFAEAAQIFLSPFLQVVFEKLYSPGVQLFLDLVRGGNLQLNTMKKWERKLRMIEALLCDAEQKQSHNNAIGLWLKDLQDLAYDMEDIFDEIATQAQLLKLKIQEQEDAGDESKDQDPEFLDLAHNMVQSILGKSSRAVESLTTLFKSDNSDMLSRIDDINDRLQDIESQVQYLGLLTVPITQHQTHQTEALVRWRETTSLVSEPVVYGRDDQKKKIMDRLLKDKPTFENYVVIPVVGQGGIGKTTLAQFIYNDTQVDDYFKIKAWVCVSDPFDVKKITTTIIHSATKKSSVDIGDPDEDQERLKMMLKGVHIDNLNEAQETLKMLLTGKRFLIVLDDVWSDEYEDWYQLQKPFRQGAKGSRVIVTTRIEKIARMMSSNATHSTIITLNGLSRDHCWSLFQQHSGECSEYAEMREDIVWKCKGLPLAAKALGGLFRSTAEKSQRQKILNSNIWREKSNLLPVLKLSYHHLPAHLKRIFAYCSIIPKDGYFSERDIVLMWMAEGFLPETKEERMEDIGHEYFHDLVSRSLFEPVGGQTFKMHDLIHDLARWSAGDICCTVDTTVMQRVCKRTRHLSFTNEVVNARFRRRLSALEKSGKLRTLAYLDRMVRSLLDRMVRVNVITQSLDPIPRFQRIRMLSLAFTKTEVLPSYIGELQHLRLLDLSSTLIEELPESTSNLCNLQTLLLEGCCCLKKLPRNTKMLINLRHLSIAGTGLQEMPLGIGKLTNLQALDIFVLAAGRGSMIRELKNLKNLHDKVVIYGLQNVVSYEDVQEARFHEKEDLNELHMNWGTCTDEVDESTQTNVLEHLRPHNSIKACTFIRYKGLTYPGWLGDRSFTNMACISLVDCENCECLPPLGQLVSLKELRVEGMHGMKQLGPDFYGCGCSNPFPALKTLWFKRMNSWMKWLHPSTGNNKAFPCLEILWIKHCPLLENYLPPHLPSLQSLEIDGCSQLSLSLPSLPSLEKLILVECKALTSIAPVIFCSRMMMLCTISEFTILPSHCLYLAELIIRDCYSILTTLDQIPLTLRKLTIDQCQGLQYVKFEESSRRFSFVQEVSISNCESLVTVDHLPVTLKRLNVGNCPKIKSIEFAALSSNNSNLEEEYIGNSENLVTADQVPLTLHNPVLNESSSTSLCFEKVSISNCQSLVSIHHIPATLGRLEIRNCEELCCVVFNESSSSSSDGGRSFLEEVIIYGCSLVSLPCMIFPRIKKLSLSKCENLEVLLSQMMHKMSSLENLSISRCPKINCFPEGGLPRNLKRLRIQKVKIEQQIQEWKLHLSCLQVLRLAEINIQQPIQEWGLHLITSLQVLGLSYIGCLDDSLDCIPGPDLSLPSSLRELTIWGFRSLKTISCSSLPSLTKLDVGHCQNLESLGDNGLPSELRDVQIYLCPLMQPWADLLSK